MAVSPSISAAPPLSVTLAPLLHPPDESPRAAFDRLSVLGFRFVQLSATQPGMRPRELDKTARRDIRATLRRKEMSVSGVDAWIPLGHFTDPVNCDRAVTAVFGAIEFAADLERVPVSVLLPEVAEVVQPIVAHAHHHGVELADHALPITSRDGVFLGIDPAAWLGVNQDPVAAVHHAGERLRAARLCDLLRSGLRGPIGEPDESRLDMQAYQVALSVNGYRQPVIVDARQWPDPWRGIERTLTRWNAAT